MSRRKDIKNKLSKAASKGQSIIHFSDLDNKLGINPKTKYKTPAGVYGYILTKESLKCLVGESRFTKKEFINKCDFSEFAIDREFVYIAEINPTKDKIVVKIKKDGSSNLSKKNFDDMIKKLKILLKDESNLINHIYWNLKEYYIDLKITEATYKSYLYTPIGWIWNITRNFARNPIAWGRLLYELGISAVFDHGTGLIHPAEPKQAVIFQTHKLNLLKKQKNKLSKKNSYYRNVAQNYKKIKSIFKLKNSEMHKGVERLFLDSGDDSIFSYNERNRLIISVDSLNPDIFYFIYKIGDLIDKENNFERESISILVTLDLGKEEFYMDLFDPNSFSYESYEEVAEINKNKVIFFEKIEIMSLDSNVIGFSSHLPINEEDLFEKIEEFTQKICDYNIFVDSKSHIKTIINEYVEIRDLSWYPLGLNLIANINRIGNIIFVVDITYHDEILENFTYPIFVGANSSDENIVEKIKKEVLSDFLNASDEIFFFSEKRLHYKKSGFEYDDVYDSYENDSLLRKFIITKLSEAFSKHNKDPFMIDLD